MSKTYTRLYPREGEDGDALIGSGSTEVVIASYQGVKETFPRFFGERNLISLGMKMNGGGRKYWNEVILSMYPIRKVVFDVDMDRATNKEFQRVIEVLVDALIEVFKAGDINKTLDLKKDLALCTSHSNVFDETKKSGHLVVQYTVRNKHESSIIHERVISCIRGRVPEEEIRGKKLWEYIDPAFSTFAHNLRVVGSYKPGLENKERPKIWRRDWEYGERKIHTELRFDIKGQQEIPPWAVLATHMIGPMASETCKCFPVFTEKKEIPLPPRRQELVDVDEEKAYELLCSGHPDLASCFNLECRRGDSIRLTRKASGYCPLCDRVHEKDNASLYIKGPRQNVYFGCFRAVKDRQEGKNQDKNTIWIGQLKPEAKEEEEPFPTPLKPTKEYTKNQVEELPSTFRGTYLLSSGTGTGKTSIALIPYLKKRVKEDQKTSIIVITPRVSFAREIHEKLREAIPDFTFYQEIQKGRKRAKKEEIQSINRLVIQLESLELLSSGNVYDEESREWYDFDYRRYDVVVLDELVSVSRQFFSETLMGRFTPVSLELEEIIRDADTVLGFDADLSDDEVRFIESLRGKTAEQVVRNNKSPNKKLCLEMPTIGMFLESLLTDLDEGKNIFFASNSKKFVEDVSDLISEQRPLIAPKCLFYHQGTKNTSHLTDVNKHWGEARLVMISPTITVGIDFSKEHFDRTYLFVGKASCSVRDLFQMVARVRRTSENTLVLFTENKPREEGDDEKPYIPPRSSLERSLKLKVKLEQCEIDGYTLDFPAMNEAFFHAYTTFLIEQMHTRKRARDEILRFLGSRNYDHHILGETESDNGFKEDPPEEGEDPPPFSEVRNLSYEEFTSIQQGRRLEGQCKPSWAEKKFILCLYVSPETSDPRQLEVLWQDWAQKGLKGKLGKNLPLLYEEKNKALFDIQIAAIDKYHVAELSKSNGPRISLIRDINKLLDIPNSHAGNPSKVLTDEILVKDIMDKLKGRREEIRSLCKKALIEDGDLENPKAIITFINSIYSSYTGYMKIKKDSKRVRARSHGVVQDMTPMVSCQTLHSPPRSCNEKVKEINLWSMIREH
ncbi:MAG: DEAD/DEAH box helicase [Vulcanimicrobiaceae bacterium]